MQAQNKASQKQTLERGEGKKTDLQLLSKFLSHYLKANTKRSKLSSKELTAVKGMVDRYKM